MRWEGRIEYALGDPERTAVAIDKLSFSMKTTQSRPEVAVLMATYNGAGFLLQQLDSIVAQSLTDWTIWASDDSDDDTTWNVLKQYQERIGGSKLHLQKGPQKGFVDNFLSLVCQANIEADYFAYCDQDDVWEVEKLSRAIQWLADIQQNVPALYCSRTRLVDEQNNEIGLSPLFSKPPSFANALVQNIGGGNTMVFNRAARSLLMQAGADLSLVAHDWWTYIVVTGCGGRVGYQSEPSVRYRQHCRNLYGTNHGHLADIKRISLLFGGYLTDANDKHLSALLLLRDRLTPSNLDLLNRYATVRRKGLMARLFALKNAGIYRQTFIGNIGLIVAIIFRKL